MNRSTWSSMVAYCLLALTMSFACPHGVSTGSNFGDRFGSQRHSMSNSAASATDPFAVWLESSSSRRATCQPRVGAEDVARPLPHVAQPAELPPDRVVGEAAAGAVPEFFLQQGHRPIPGVVAPGRRRPGQQFLEQGPCLVRPEGRPAGAVSEGEVGRVV